MLKKTALFLRDGSPKEVLPTRKRKSPSTLRRNAKRREDFLKKKSTSESASATSLESNQKPTMQRQGFQCDACDFQSKSENGLKIHKGKSHKEVRSPEKLRKVFIQPCVSHQEREQGGALSQL